MSKRSCCCDGSYIAIPCRFATVQSFTQQPGIPPAPGGFDPGTPGQSLFWVFRQGGSNLGEPLGPFRTQDGLTVFDSSRDVVYMLRGAGGGAAGPNVTETENDKRYGLGGNGAYTEYQKTASLTDVVRPGQGGRGGETYQFGNVPDGTRKTGGQSRPVTAQGGDASVLMNENVTVGAAPCFEPPIAVAGGGGGGGMVLTPSNIKGGRKGGDAGIDLAQSGENGYSTFLNQVLGGGGGATDLRGGTAIGGSAPDPTGTRSRDGTECSGGQSELRTDALNNVFGNGGGGGGGLFGGGGGGVGGGGGGGSSTQSYESRGNTYSFISRSSLSANYCNPYLQTTNGVGGKKLPDNTSQTGKDGEAVVYYIYAFCDCDPIKNELPDPLFICLNKSQYDDIVDSAGPLPPSGFGCQLMFNYNGERYILLGTCADTCEEVYQIPGDANITNAEWACRTSNSGEGPSAGGGEPWNSPACCEQVVCTKLCPIEGANCANCGCAGASNDILVCCDVDGKPEEYLSVYDGFVYRCTRTRSNWIVPGQTVETTKQCLSPIDGITCNQQPIDCDVTLSETYNGCNWITSANCGVYGAQVVANNTTVSIYCNPEDEINGPCRTQSNSYSDSFLMDDFDGSAQFSGSSSKEYSCNGNVYSTFSIARFNYVQSRVEEELVMRITFDCIPPQDGFGAYPIQLPIFGGTGLWVICGASVLVSGGAYLSSIAQAFNVRSGGRVFVDDLTTGKFFVSPDWPDQLSRIEYVVTDVLTVNIYAPHSYIKACGYATFSLSNFCGGVSKISYFTSSEIDGWNVTTPQVQMCACQNIGDIGSITICPDPCGTIESFDPCGNLQVIIS